jgi:pyruvate/2-oxoglutarate/acetoin dehydrogenase E1 component
MATGGGRQVAAQHSRSLEGWYAHIPGLKVLTPATLEDARGMLWTALEDPDPVLIFGGPGGGVAHAGAGCGTVGPHHRGGVLRPGRAPVLRVASAEVPIPYAKHMEEAALPQPDDVIDAVRAVTHHG